MAIETNGGTVGSSLHVVYYSSTLGALYEAKPENQAAIEAAMAAIGGEDWKKGFQGTAGDVPSARARRMLPEGALALDGVRGLLSNVEVRDSTVEGHPAPYLKVVIRDGDRVEFLSLDLNREGTQMLVRQLANAKPNSLTRINLFATYGQDEGKDRPYAKHGSMLRQAETLEGLKSKDANVQTCDIGALTAAVAAAVEQLRTAGVPESDRETYRRRREAVRLEFHRKLAEAVSVRFAENAKRATTTPEAKAEPATAQAAA